MNEIPKGELAIKVLAMPKDTNPDGDIFGGWILSQMDVAGGIYSQRKAKGKVVTVAIESMVFKMPVFIGDTLSCYAVLQEIGRTSIKVRVDAYVNRQHDLSECIKVTEGVFTYVKVDENGKPVPIDK